MRPIIIPIIFTYSLKKNQIRHAIIATKYLQILPVEICMLSGCLARDKYNSKIYVFIKEPNVPIINPKIKELEIIIYKTLKNIKK